MRHEQWLKDMDALNHALGGYVLRAFHEPRKYPRKPSSGKGDDRGGDVMKTDEEIMSYFKTRFKK